MWDVGEEGATTRAVWERVNEGLGEGKSISRTSIILFLEKLEGQGVLGSWDATGKGGHHKIYYPLMNEEQFWRHVARKLYVKVVEASGDESIFARARRAEKEMKKAELKSARSEVYLP